MINLPIRQFLTLVFAVGLFCTSAQVTDSYQRPQEPTPPFSYLSKDITFKNPAAGITLTGTLTLPDGPDDFPYVILISGSSPYNRNEEIAGHKPFLVLADHLTRKGIGVLRYDDRGIGGSEGTYLPAAYGDRVSDALSALAFLKNEKGVNTQKIGLIGHSEGGLIAAMAAAASKEVDMITMMGAPGLTGYEMMQLRIRMGHEQEGLSPADSKKELEFLTSIFDLVMDPDTDSTDIQSFKSRLKNQLKSSPQDLPSELSENKVDGYFETFATPWFRRILLSDPVSTLQQVNCPVLAINGSKDLQIPPEINLRSIEDALEKNGKVPYTVKELAGLNHLFQEAETGEEEEFETITQTISPVALEVISEWIQELR